MTRRLQAPARISRVETLSFPELFRKCRNYPLALDTYQRPYVWSEQKVAQLCADLREFLDDGRDVDYYVGTVLLHRNADAGATFVIDGQQRLTTLLVLHHALTGTLPDGQNFSFRSPQSERNIRTAQKITGKAAAGIDAQTLFPRIRFTVVVVPSEDLAFTFFDTQNHRGVPLEATDLLKAYHLRAIGGDAGEALQTTCAARWEHMQRARRIADYEGDPTPALFEKILWRARRWRGRQLGNASHDAIVDEFQTRSIAPPGPASVPLYPARLNTLATRLDVSASGRLRLDLTSVALGDDAIDLPFSIRQPVSQGLGFFLYADKYAALAQQLLHKTDSPAPGFRDFHAAVIAGISIYLREFFLLASVMFADRFGSERLHGFGLWLDHVLGAIRMQKAYLFEAAPRLYLQGAPNNLLDVIAGAYTADEVIDFLRDDPRPAPIYEADEIEAGAGVRGRYKQCVLDYYGRTGSLAGKHDWVVERLAEIGQ